MLHTTTKIILTPLFGLLKSGDLRVDGDFAEMRIKKTAWLTKVKEIILQTVRGIVTKETLAIANDYTCINA